jgi:hypothetical protein
MIITRADAHPIFNGCIRAIDVLQRGYMRVLAHLSAGKDCRTGFGAVIRSGARDLQERRIRFFGVYAHNLTFYISKKLKEGDVYVEIGAGSGYFSLLASRCVGAAGRVISIEADSEVFADLTKNLERNGCRNATARNVSENETVFGHDAGGATLRDLVGDDLASVHFIKVGHRGSEEPFLRAVLRALPELPRDLTVAAEVSSRSAEHVARFVMAGFRAYAIRTVDSIDYYLIRSYLSRYDEDDAVHLVPVSCYDPRWRDYIFERSGDFDQVGRLGVMSASTRCLRHDSPSCVLDIANLN